MDDFSQTVTPPSTHGNTCGVVLKDTAGGAWRCRRPLISSRDALGDGERQVSQGTTPATDPLRTQGPESTNESDSKKGRTKNHFSKKGRGNEMEAGGGWRVQQVFKELG